MLNIHIGICCFSAKHAEVLSIGLDWSAWSRNKLPGLLTYEQPEQLKLGSMCLFVALTWILAHCSTVLLLRGG